MRSSSRTQVDEAVRLAALRSSCLLGAPADPEFDLITEIAARTFNVPIALVSLVDEDRLWFISSVGLEVRQAPRADAFCSEAINRLAPLVILDAQVDSRFDRSAFVTGEPHARFYAGAPLVTADGSCLGTLCVIDRRPRKSFTNAEKQILRSFAKLIMERIETRRTIGTVDRLTLLPNRARFIEDIKLWRAEDVDRAAGRATIAVDICGVDYFYGMVRALGCECAEGYLLAAKRRLCDLLGPTPLYRVGETLFAFVHDEESSSLPSVFRRLSSAFDRPLEYDGIPYAAAVSIGAVRLGERDEANDLLRALITAADMARRDGGDGSIYERDHDDAQQRAFRILAALAEAVGDDDQLSLRYQPRVHLATGECVGVEALLRWHHPTLGEISPCEFVPLAEKTTLIIRMTQWVVEHVLEQARRWQQAGHRFTVSINVSAMDLEHADFIDTLWATLQRHRLDATLLEIEFTESAMSQRQEHLAASMARLRSLGLQIAIDDFGAGYSNFTYLKRIPATTLKIDQSFIRSMLSDERNSAIVPSMIALGHKLGHRIVAEGIESKAVYDQVRHWGCDEGQGFWMSKPLTAVELEAWLQTKAREAQATQIRAAERHRRDRQIEARYFCTTKRPAKGRSMRR